MGKGEEVITLEPEVGASMFGNNPASICVSIADVANMFGLTKEEMLTELRTGRLVARGQSDGRGGFGDIAIRGDNLIEWIIRTNRDGVPAQVSEVNPLPKNPGAP